MNPPDLTAYLSRPSPVESELRQLFRRDEPLVIFDIGACEGEESVRYARLFPRARILSFEPLPSNQALVRANFARYGVTRAELLPLALSDRAGEATFHVSSGQPPTEFSGRDWNYGNKSSSLLPPAAAGPMHGWIEFKEAIVVPTDTLDAVCARHAIDRIDFVHMDVQGAEHLVLAGAARLLPNISALWLEVADRELYRGQKLRREMEALLHARGFSLGFAAHGGIEGDQFYVNRRRPRAWRYLAARRAATLLGRARRFAGRIKHLVTR